LEPESLDTTVVKEIRERLAAQHEEQEFEKKANRVVAIWRTRALSPRHFTISERRDGL